MCGPLRTVRAHDGREHLQALGSIVRPPAAVTGGNNDARNVVLGHVGDNRLELGGVLREGGGVDDALLNQVIDVRQSVAEAILDEARLDLTVLDIVVAVRVGVRGEGADERGDNVCGRPAGRAAHQADLILLTVAVGIVLHERLQHSLELLCGGGDFEAQILQEIHVDPHLYRRLVPRAGVDGGQRVDMTVRHGHHAADEVVFFLAQLVVGVVVSAHLLVIIEEIVDREQHALVGIAHDIRGAEFHVDDVRQLRARVNQHRQLGAGVLAGQHEELQIDAELFLEQQRLGVGLEVLDEGVRRTCDHEHRGFAFGRRRYDAGKRHAQNKGQG